MDEDKFKVMRTLTALCHIDGRVSKSEQDFIVGLLKAHSLTDQQKNQIEEDFKNPADVISLFQSIKTPRNRGWLIDTARMLFFKDGSFSAMEKISLDQLQDVHSQTIDLNMILAEVSTAGEQAGRRFDIVGNSKKSDDSGFTDRLKKFLK